MLNAGEGTGNYLSFSTQGQSNLQAPSKWMGTARALSAVSFRQGCPDRSYVECEPSGDSEAVAVGYPVMPVA